MGDTSERRSISFSSYGIPAMEFIGVCVYIRNMEDNKHYVGAILESSLTNEPKDIFQNRQASLTQAN